MEDIKAIETEYNGYRFRSRLEARWAVYFDEIGIEYEYEPQGLILSDGTYYLPDFYLINVGCYFEVKPKGLSPRERIKAIYKISDGMRTCSWAGMICFGDPMDNDVRIYCQAVGENSGWIYSKRVHIGVNGWDWDFPMISVCDDDLNDAYFSLMANYSDGGYIKNIDYYNGYHSAKERFESSINCEKAKEAMKKARQARFEHGETPTASRSR